MEVEFVLLPEDYLAFQNYFLDHPPKRSGKRVGGSFWVFLVFFGLLTALGIPALLEGELSFRTLGPPALLVVCLFMLIFFRPLMRWLMRRSVKRNIETNPKALGWRRVTLAPEALTTTSENGSTTALWAGIEQIVITGEHALIFSSPTMAHLVPKRAFADESAFREFVATARRYRDAARGGESEERSSDRKPRESDTNIKSDQQAGH